MRRQFFGALITSFLTFALVASAASAQGFKRYGPVSFGGYPAWYQDKTGLGMEFCSPLNPSELDGGWCLLLTGDTTAPESFPNSFFDEHFYWAANADANGANTVPGMKALLVTALEGAFAVGPVINGDQIVFGRLRIVLNPLPASGTYTVYTPFGKYVFPNQVAGDKLFFTEDIGIQCAPGDFTCALASKIGPFLLPSVLPGGAEMPAVSASNPTPDTDPAHFGGVFTPTPYPGTGKKYIADPARIGPVTGSPMVGSYATSSGPRNPNIFRVEGPNGLVLETTDFSLMGRVFEGGIPGRVTVDRASYAKSASANRLSVFATGLPSTQARIPAGSQPADITPILQYYDAPCVANLDPSGALLSYSVPATQAVQIRGSGTSYFGQSEPAAIPLEVCVVQTNAIDGGGNTFTAFFPANVGDQVTITDALYDPINERLTIQASSSDEVSAITLTALGFGDLTAGSLVVSNLIAPPSTVQVRSSARGSAELQVRTSAGSSGSGTTVPTATNDTFPVQEDSAGNVLPVTANDTVGGSQIPAGSIVQLTALPQKGQAQVLADGTVSYTPNPNANGPDSFAYTVAVNGIVSNQASVTINVQPVNDIPVAVNDSFNAIVGTTVVLGVLANDLDADGAADIVGISNLTQPTPAGATVALVGGSLQFTATAPGTYTFTYRPQDVAGAVSSNTATVTVTVLGGETINVTLAEFRTGGGGRLRFAGTITPVTNPPQRLTIRWFNGTNTVSVVATPQADGAGAWTIDLKPATGIQDPRTSGATQYIVTSPTNASRTGTIAIR